MGAGPSAPDGHGLAGQRVDRPAVGRTTTPTSSARSATLARQGYVVAGGAAPGSFELVDAGGRQVDVHPVTLTAAGDGRYRMRDGAEWVYPAAGFTGTGVVAGQSVPCLTAEVMMLGHTTGYALDRTHRDDVIALSRICGVALPSFEVAD